ncbi:hypothetical protein D4S03_09470 [bacterium]|nr:MAG: hypothetical protein D4S03_09470 [bacterium]
MKKIVLALVLLIAICLPLNSTAGEHFFDTIMDETLSGPKETKQVNLAGYKEFTVFVSMTIAPTTGEKGLRAVELDIMQSPAPGGGFRLARETVFPVAKGPALFKNTYRIYLPYISVAVVNPSPDTKAQIFVYAVY